MKHFLSLWSSAARLTKAAQCVLLMTLVPTMHLIAGGGFVPVQIHEAPQSILQPTGAPLQNPVLQNDAQLENLVADTEHPSRFPANGLINTFSPQRQIVDNVQLEYLAVEHFQTRPEPTASYNPFLLNDARLVPATSDPKGDLEINIRIDNVDIARLNGLDNDLVFLNPSVTIPQPVLYLENNGIPTSAEPEPAEIATSTDALNSELLELVAWPNPSFGHFQATFKGADPERMTYRIVNLSGQILQICESESSAVSFDLSGYPAGIYWLQVIQGDVKLATRILLER